MKNNWSFVIFDMDGTLIDSAKIVTSRFARTFQKFGVEVPNISELHSLLGPSAASTMEKYLNSGDAADGLAHYRQLASEDGVTGIEAFAGIREVLRKLSETGITLAVATSKPEEEAVQILEHLGLLFYFSVISGASDKLGIHKKSDVIKSALNRLQPISIEKVVMVGDRIFDIEGAAECGIDSIFVTWGGASEAEGENATAIVQNPSNLYQLIVN